MLHRPVSELAREAAQWLHTQIHPHRDKPRQWFLASLDALYHPALKRHWEKKYARPHRQLAPWVLVFDLFLLTVLSALVVGGVMIWLFLPAQKEPAVVVLEVNLPNIIGDIEIGAPTTIDLAWRNSTPENLSCAVIVLMAQGRFVPERAPEAADSNCAAAAFADVPRDAVIVPVGPLAAGSSGTKALPGRFYGGSGDVINFTAELRYWRPAATRQSIELVRLPVSLTGSLASLDIKTEAELSYGRRLTVSIPYALAGDRGYEQAVLRIMLPKGFRVTSTNPQIPGSGLEWPLGPLAPGAEGAVAVIGVLPTGAASLFGAELAATAGGREIMLQKISRTLDFRAADFDLSLTPMAPAAGLPVRPGSDIKLAIKFNNSGNQTMRKIRISLQPTSALWDGKAAWSGTERSELALLIPGAGGTIETTLRVPPEITSEMFAGEDAPVIGVTAVAEYLYGEDTRTVVAETIPLEIPVTTLISAKAAAFYFTTDGEQIGTGPLPPKVGEATKYRIIWQVRNGAGAAEGVTLSARLPENVSWTGRATSTGGEGLDYLASSRTVVWKLGAVAAFAGGDENRLGASFEVALTPSEEQVGAPAILTAGGTITGRDVATQSRLTESVPDVTTESTYDLRAGKRARVVK